MANYIRRYSKYLIPAVAAGSGLLLFNNVVNDEKNLVFAARTITSSSGGTGLSVYKWDSNWDRKNPKNMVEEKGISEGDDNYQAALEKCKPKATRNLFLIRHGQYNLKGTVDEERYLTSLGRIQAEFTGIRLKEYDFPYQILHRSSMTRAKETADIILDCFKEKPFQDIRTCNLLEEGAPIPPDPPVKHWRPEVHQFFVDGPRIEAAFRKYFYRADVSQVEDSYEIIVCHANVIRYFVCRALQFPPDAWLRFTLHHCSITWIVITPTGRVIVRSVGDSGHLPPDAVTSS